MIGSRLSRVTRLVLVTAFGLIGAGLFAPAPLSSVAGAEGPASSSASSSLYVGFVHVEPGDPIPTKIRALGAEGVNCGTGTVRVVGEDLGFYQLTVMGADAREGCPRPGGDFAFRLLYGRIGEGVPATPDADVTFRPGETSVVSLGASDAFAARGWSGTLPESGKTSFLRWNGPESLDIEDAAALLGGSVASLWHFDSATRTTLFWSPDSPRFTRTYLEVEPGDVVLVRAR